MKVGGEQKNRRRRTDGWQTLAAKPRGTLLPLEQLLLLFLPAAAERRRRRRKKKEEEEMVLTMKTSSSTLAGLSADRFSAQFGTSNRSRFRNDFLLAKSDVQY